MIVAKQPNGLYCAFTENETKHNLTEQDYYDLALEELKKRFHEDGYIFGLDYLIRHVSDDAILSEMGFDKPHNELLKFIPKQVVNTTYVGHDCTTYGHCPTCNASVESGYGGTDKKCKNCGQILEW